MSAAVLTQTSFGAAPLDEIREDTDPTKPVLFSFRNEYYRLLNDAWQNQTILRMDSIILPNTSLPGGAKGSITRLDIPYVKADYGRVPETGLGDIYGQLLLVPPLKNGNTIAYGSGLTVP